MIGESPDLSTNQGKSALPDIASSFASGCRDTDDLTVSELRAYSAELSKKAPTIAGLALELVANVTEGAPITETFDMLVCAERAVAEAQHYPAG